MNLQPTLVGETLLLRPLRAEDWDALYEVASDPGIWEQHPESTRYQRPVFEGFFRKALESGGALAVLDRRTGAMIGSSRYYEADPSRREVAIGYTFLARSHWGGSANREMKRLMIGHILPWADTLWFHVGTENHRSRRAMEKIGGVLSHIAGKELYGKVTEMAFYRIGRDCPLLREDPRTPPGNPVADPGTGG
ncbi:MAG: GNAT family N-acetyltransferase [Verrucomicrobiales bacterium]|nr:GNAT family N-acetyltransferase [Verrucomicrobiales bacterium]